MARYGYARVSTQDQHLGGQEARLKEAGCERVWKDKASGTKASRPEWDQLFAYLRPGDTLVVCKLDRLGRSLINLVDIITQMDKRGVDLVILDLGIDTSTNHGRLIFDIMSALAAWEARLIAERTVEGLEAARARRGVTKLPGRKVSYSADQWRLGRELMAARESNGMSAARIAQVIGTSTSGLYRIMRADAPPET